MARLNEMSPECNKIYTQERLIPRLCPGNGGLAHRVCSSAVAMTGKEDWLTGRRGWTDMDRLVESKVK